MTELTGLRLDPYFSGTKLVWLAENEPNTWALVERRPLRDRHRRLLPDRPDDPRHAGTSPTSSNACRTLLFDLEAGAWSEELCDLFGVPMDALPEVVPNWGSSARTDPKAFLDLELPIAGIAGDQQSALFGQTCFDAGRLQVHLRHGLVHPRPTPASEVVRSDAGLLSTAAWKAPDGSSPTPSRARSS